MDSASKLIAHDGKKTDNFPFSSRCINRHLPNLFVTGEDSSSCGAFSSFCTWYSPHATMLRSLGQADTEQAEYCVSTRSSEEACIVSILYRKLESGFLCLDGMTLLFELLLQSLSGTNEGKKGTCSFCCLSHARSTMAISSLNGNY